MMRRRGAVHGDPRVIEVGLDELLRTGYERTEQDPDPDSDGDDADLGEWRADEAGASFGVAFFGWLVASGIVVLLLTLVGVVGTLIGWDKLAGWAESETSTEWLYLSAWI